MSTAGQTTRRVIEPFVYFPNHASAIPGLGGKHRGPDPNYCFHTHYFEYSPGTVVLHITLENAQATMGALSIRIHGYRPENPELGIKLIAADRVLMEGIVDESRVIQVHFPAIPGVHYAAYGYFSEPTDLVAEGMSIIAEEMADDDIANYQEGHAPETLLTTADLAGVNALTSESAPHLEFPSSQLCTSDQAAPANLGVWSPETADVDDHLNRWKCAFILRSLSVYGLLQSSAVGLAIGPLPASLTAAIKGHGCRLKTLEMSSDKETELLTASLGHFDFILCFDSSAAVTGYNSTELLADKAVQRLMTKGFAILMLDYAAIHADLLPDTPGDLATADHLIMDRGAVQRIALRMISRGCDVAQLNFNGEASAIARPDGSVPFGLIIRR